MSHQATSGLAGFGTSRLPFCHAGVTACAVAITIFLALGGCGDSGKSAPPPAVEVETARASVQPITLSVRAEGVLFPVQQASISPKITAPVEKFFVERGQRVHKGQQLAVLENHDLAGAVAAAKGSYEQAKAAYASVTATTLPEEIQTAHLNLKNAQSNLTAQQRLYDSERKLYAEGAIARKQLDTAQVALTAAQSAFETAKKHLETLESSGATQQQKAAKGTLEAARGQYETAQANLAYTEIRSPIAGVVASRAVFPGDVAPAGVPLLIVINTSSVIVRLHIGEDQAALLKVGDPATLNAPGFAQAFPAKVTVVSPALDPNSTTVEVWVEAANPKGELKPGASVIASITAQTVPNALVIPAEAVLKSPDGGSYVMIVGPDSRAVSRPVKTGIQNGSRIQILSGLGAGDDVIVQGAFGLPDNTRVRATPVGPNAANPGTAP